MDDDVPGPDEADPAQNQAMGRCDVCERITIVRPVFDWAYLMCWNCCPYTDAHLDDINIDLSPWLWVREYVEYLEYVRDEDDDDDDDDDDDEADSVSAASTHYPGPRALVEFPGAEEDDDWEAQEDDEEPE